MAIYHLRSYYINDVQIQSRKMGLVTLTGGETEINIVQGNVKLRLQHYEIPRERYVLIQCLVEELVALSNP